MFASKGIKLTNEFVESVRVSELERFLLEFLVENGKVNHVFKDGSSLLLKAPDKSSRRYLVEHNANV